MSTWGITAALAIIAGYILVLGTLYHFGKQDRDRYPDTKEPPAPPDHGLR